MKTNVNLRRPAGLRAAGCARPCPVRWHGRQNVAPPVTSWGCPRLVGRWQPSPIIGAGSVFIAPPAHRRRPLGGRRRQAGQVAGPQPLSGQPVLYPGSRTVYARALPITHASEVRGGTESVTLLYQRSGWGNVNSMPPHVLTPAGRAWQRKQGETDSLRSFPSKAHLPGESLSTLSGAEAFCFPLCRLPHRPVPTELFGPATLPEHQQPGRHSSNTRGTSSAMTRAFCASS